VKHETHRLGGAVRRQSRRQAASLVEDAVSRTPAVAGHDQKKPARVRGAGTAAVPVVRAIWRDAQGTRLCLTYVTRGTVDFENLDTGGHGVMSRAWLEKHFTPIS
jgi:hypothetical protein